MRGVDEVNKCYINLGPAPKGKGSASWAISVTFNFPSNGNNVDVTVVVQSSLFSPPFWPEVTVGLD